MVSGPIVGADEITKEERSIKYIFGSEETTLGLTAYKENIVIEVINEYDRTVEFSVAEGGDEKFAQIVLRPRKSIPLLFTRGSRVQFHELKKSAGFLETGGTAHVEVVVDGGTPPVDEEF